MSRYLKRWRSRSPRAVGASEEWEELGSLSREASDREEEDAVVVAASATAAAPPPAKVEASPPVSNFEDEEEDTHPFALLRLRIRPASVAFWVRKPGAVARAAPLGHARLARTPPRRAAASGVARKHLCCAPRVGMARLAPRRRRL